MIDLGLQAYSLVGVSLYDTLGHDAVGMCAFLDILCLKRTNMLSCLRVHVSLSSFRSFDILQPLGQHQSRRDFGYLCIIPTYPHCPKACCSLASCESDNLD